MCADADGPKLTDLFEVQRRVMRISFEKFKVLVRHFTNGVWKTPVVSPEAW